MYNTGNIVRRYFNGDTAWEVNYSQVSSIGTPLSQTTSSSTDCVAKFNGSILTTRWAGSSSSYKIKKDIEELNDNECLNTRSG